MRQTSLDGTETDSVRPPPPLTDRQREVLRYMRLKEKPVRPIEIGAIMHAGRADLVLVAHYFSSDGVDALKRLERRGLVEKLARGQWVAKIRSEDW